MQILEMAAVHTAQIAALEGEIFSLPWDEPSIRAELSNPLSLWLVAAEGADVLGYVGSQTCFEDTDILNVAVRPDCRRRGVPKPCSGNWSSACTRAGAGRSPLRSAPPTCPPWPSTESWAMRRSGCGRATTKNRARTRGSFKSSW